MKILYVATVRSHIGQFHTYFIKKLKENGHKVEAACRDNSADKKGLDLSMVDKFYYLPFERTPWKKGNIEAYKQLKKLLIKEEYDIIHCHTPMGAVIARMAAHSVKARAKVLYTAHGFHFFKGASWKNWLFFYPIEKYLSRYTDCLITINQEDYELACRKKFRAGRIERVNGVGVELKDFRRLEGEERESLRAEYGIMPQEFVLIYAADLSYRKNQKMLIEALAYLKDESIEIKALLPGQPILEAEYSQYAKEKGVEQNISFMGYRRDINKLLSISDLAVSTSRQEGLPVNLMEAMAAELPLVVTEVRGNAEMVANGENGYLIALNDAKDMAEKMLKIYNEKERTRKMGERGRKESEKYSVENVQKQLSRIYRQYGVEIIDD